MRARGRLRLTRSPPSFRAVDDAPRYVEHAYRSGKSDFVVERACSRARKGEATRAQVFAAGPVQGEASAEQLELVTVSCVDASTASGDLAVGEALDPHRIPAWAGNGVLVAHLRRGSARAILVVNGVKVSSIADQAIEETCAMARQGLVPRPSADLGGDRSLPDFTTTIAIRIAEKP